MNSLGYFERMTAVKDPFKLQLVQPTATQVQAIWQASTQATIFTKPELLACLAHQVQWWGVQSQQELVCAWPICLNAESALTAPEFAYYLGPIWSVSFLTSSPRRKLLLEMAVLELLLPELLARYQQLQFSTQPGWIDVRALQWWAQNHDYSCEVKIRYSAEIHGLAELDEAKLLQLFGRTRSVSIAQSMRRGVRLVQQVKPEAVLQLYKQTLAKQGEIGLAERRAEELLRLVEACQKDAGFVIAGAIAMPEQTASQQLINSEETIDAVWVVPCAKGRACGAISASNSRWRAAGHNAWLMWQTLLKARALGMACFDFNGANSFARGSDKHSYGAEVSLYFSIILSKATR